MNAAPPLPKLAIRVSRAPRASRSARRPFSMRRLLANVLPPFLFFLFVLGIWLLLTYVVLEPRRRFLMPPPQDVISKGFLDTTTRTTIMEALFGTARVAFIGLAIAIVLGMAIAIAMSQARWVERTIYPWAVVLQTIPILALVPLLGFWFGFGVTSRVIVCVLLALFPIITNTLFGMKSVEPVQRDLFRLQRVGRFARLWKLQLPASLPATFTGLRIAAGLSVIGAVVGDFFFRQGEAGIGRLLDEYTARLQSAELFAAVIVASLLGLGVFWVFGLISHLAIGSWHQSARGKEERT